MAKVDEMQVFWNCKGGEKERGREKEASEFDRLFALLITFNRQEMMDKEELKAFVRERIAKKRMFCNSNEQFAETCIASTVADALLLETLVVSSISEQLERIYFQDYFLKELLEGNEAEEKAPKKPKRKNQQRKRASGMEEEKIELKPIFDSCDEEQDEKEKVKEKEKVLKSAKATPVKGGNNSNAREKEANLNATRSSVVAAEQKFKQVHENKNDHELEQNEEKEEKGGEEISDPLNLGVFVSAATNNVNTTANSANKNNSTSNSKRTRQSPPYTRSPLLQELISHPKQEEPDKPAQSGKTSLLEKMKNDKQLQAKKQGLKQQQQTAAAPPPQKLPKIESYVVKSHGSHFSAKQTRQAEVGQQEQKSECGFVEKKGERRVEKAENEICRDSTNDEKDIPLKLSKKSAGRESFIAANLVCLPAQNQPSTKKEVEQAETPGIKRHRRRPSSHSVMKAPSDLLSKSPRKNSPANIPHLIQDVNNFRKKSTTQTEPGELSEKKIDFAEHSDLDANSCLSLQHEENPSEQNNNNSITFSPKFQEDTSSKKVEVARVEKNAPVDKKAPKLKKIVKDRISKDSGRGRNANLSSSYASTYSDSQKWYDKNESSDYTPSYKQSSNNYNYDNYEDSGYRQSNQRFKNYEYSNSNSNSNSNRERYETYTKSSSNLPSQNMTSSAVQSTNVNSGPSKLSKQTQTVKDEKVAQIKRVSHWNTESRENVEATLPDATQNANANASSSNGQVVKEQTRSKADSKTTISSSVCDEGLSAQQPKKKAAPVEVVKKAVILKASRWDNDAEVAAEGITEKKGLDLYDVPAETNLSSSYQQKQSSGNSNNGRTNYKSYNSTIRKLPKGNFQRTDSNVTESIKLPHGKKPSPTPHQKFGKRFSLFVEESILQIVDDLEAFSERFRAPREICKDRINRIVQKTFNHPAIFVAPYGSVVTGLLTPFSDMDLAIKGCFFERREHCIEMLTTIHENLQLFPFIRKVTPILTAAIPVLKIEADAFEPFEDSPTAAAPSIVKIDLIVEQFEEFNAMSTAFRTTDFTKGCVAFYKTFYPNVLALKFALSCNRLSVAYRGGLNAYGVSLLYLAFVESKGEESFENCGDALLAFLHFLNFEFDPNYTAVFFGHQRR